MKKLVAVIAILAVCSSFAYLGAVHPKTASADGTMQEVFIKDYGTNMDLEQEYAVPMPNGDVVVFGMAKTHSTDGRDFFLMRVTEKGRIVWAKRYARKGDETIIDYTDAKPTSDGGIILTAITGGNRNRLAVVKINGNGNIEWQKVFPEYEAAAWDIIQTSDGGFVIGMQMYPPKGSGQDLYSYGFLLTKLDKSGGVLWSKIYYETNATDAGAFLAEDNNGNIIASGRRYPPKGGSSDPLLLKVGKDGKLIWEEEIKCGPKDDGGDGIIKALDGNGFVVAGWTHSLGSGNYDEMIYKISNDGELQWLKTYGWNKYDVGVLIFPANNGYTSFMKTESIDENKTDSVYFKIDSDGNVLFSKVLTANRDFIGDDIGICQTADNGLMFPISSESFSDRNIWNDLVMVKTDSDGNVPGCKYIKDAKLKAVDHTKSVTVVRFTPKVQDVSLKEEDAGFNAVALKLNVKTVCQPEPEKVVLLSPKDKSSSQIPVTLKWQDTPNADTYEVQLADKSDFSNVILDKVVEEPSFTVPTDKIEKGKTYYWRVRGINALNKGDWSEIFSFSTIDLPSKPSVSVSLSNGGATLSWEQVKQGTYPIKGYAIYRGEEKGKEDLSHPIATVDANTTQYTDKTVEVGKTYYYIVKAFDDQTPPNYSKPSNEVSIEIKDTTPPIITINSPEDGAETSDDFVSVSGTITDDLSGIDSATINGNSLTLNSDGSFSTTVSLTEGDNTITITATDKAGNKATKTITVTYKPKTVITLQPDNPMMTVNGVQQEIDPGRGTKPVIIPKWGRTVVPIRAIVEALGGTIEWDGTERKVTINFNGTIIELWIDKPQARVNGEMKWIDPNNHDVKPIIINSRTMLPLRFVAENLGCTVQWDAATRTITITYTP